MSAPSLPPEAEAELKRLYTETRTSSAEIATRLNEAFGLSLWAENIVWLSQSRGFRRHAGKPNPAAQEDLKRLMKWEEWSMSDPPPDNPVRRVPRGTFPARGFTMLRRTG